MNELAKSALIWDAWGIRTKLDLTRRVDPRILLMLVCDSLAAAEHKGCGLFGT